jgi:hypothetical protein
LNPDNVSSILIEEFAMSGGSWRAIWRRVFSAAMP